MQVTQYMFLPIVSHGSTDHQVAVMCQEMQQWANKGREVEDCFKHLRKKLQILYEEGRKCFILFWLVVLNVNTNLVCLPKKHYLGYL